MSTQSLSNIPLFQKRPRAASPAGAISTPPPLKQSKPSVTGAAENGTGAEGAALKRSRGRPKGTKKVAAAPPPPSSNKGGGVAKGGGAAGRGRGRPKAAPVKSRRKNESSEEEDSPSEDEDSEADDSESDE